MTSQFCDQGTGAPEKSSKKDIILFSANFFEEVRDLMCSSVDIIKIFIF